MKPDTGPGSPGRPCVQTSEKLDWIQMPTSQRGGEGKERGGGKEKRRGDRKKRDGGDRGEEGRGVGGGERRDGGGRSPCSVPSWCGKSNITELSFQG